MPKTCAEFNTRFATRAVFVTHILQGKRQMENPILEKDQIIDSIRELAGTSRQKARALKAEAEQAAHTQELWANLLLYVEKEWYRHVLDLVEKESASFRALRAENHPAVPSLEKLVLEARAKAQELRNLMPKYLEEAARIHDLPIEPESRHPRYVFEKGFFRVEIDDTKGIARLTDNEGELAKFPADPGAIIEKLEQEKKRVFGRPFDATAFLRKLRQHYLAVLKKENQADGASIPIRSITRRLGKNEKGFRTDEFLLDLSRLVTGGRKEIDGRHLDLQQTQDTNQGMLLYGQAGRGYVGFITFTKE